MSASAGNVSQSAAAKRAAGSSFYTAMRILPPPQREAMFEIYSFCRAVDDIADSEDSRPVRHAQLASWRLDVERMYSGSPPKPLARLTAVARTFNLGREDFLAVIEGMEMDVTEDIRAPTLAKLDHYCDCVASAVGRLSVHVFGMAPEDGRLLAHHLGRALQLTNILRDLDEDAAVGRLYLPRELLVQAGITSTEPAEVLAHPALDLACAGLAARAREHFKAATMVMDHSPKRAVRAPRLMGEVYRMMLDRMEARGWEPPRLRVRIPRPLLVWLMLRRALL